MSSSCPAGSRDALSSWSRTRPSHPTSRRGRQTRTRKVRSAAHRRQRGGHQLPEESHAAHEDRVPSRPQAGTGCSKARRAGPDDPENGRVSVTEHSCYNPRVLTATSRTRRTVTACALEAVRSIPCRVLQAEPRQRCRDAPPQRMWGHPHPATVWGTQSGVPHVAVCADSWASHKARPLSIPALVPSTGQPAARPKWRFHHA